jgi:outer membrane protein assembly factor BamD (BamD/ComL family)
LFAHGKYREAAAAYERLAKAAVKDDETKAYAQFQEGLCRLKDNRKSEAFSIWAQMRLFHPKCEFVPTSLLLEAENTTNPTRADNLRTEILSKYPNATEAATVLLQRGQTACDRKDYKAAAQFWKQFLDSFPDHASNAVLRTRLETAQLAMSGKQAAANDLEAASLLPRADALFDRAEYGEASKLYGRVVERGGMSRAFPQAVVRMAQCQMAMNQQRQAFETLQRAVDQMPANASTLLVELVSQTASRREGDELRLRATRLLMDRNPNSFEAQQALYIAGFVEMTRKNTPKAREWWNQLLTNYPNTGFRAAIEKELRFDSEERKKQEAQKRQGEEAKQAKNRAPEERARAEQRARWQAESREWAKRYADASAGERQRAKAVFRMAERSFYLQQYEVAAQQFQRVWTEFPETSWAEQAALDLAQMWFATGNAKKGMEQLRFLVNRFPSGSLRPLALYCLGNRYLLHEAKVKAGWACYEQLLNDYPTHPLTQETRRFWALLNRYPPEKLETQLANLRAKTK